MDSPIPTHLKDVLLVDDKKSSEKKLYATLQCCGNYGFEIQKSQNDLVCVIKAICVNCKKEIIVFDNRLHGWDGYVCHLWQDEKQSAFETVEHKKERVFSVNLKINSEGKTDFIKNVCQENVEEAGRKLEEWEWVNAFGWIDLDLECFKCKKSFNLISYETM